MKKSIFLPIVAMCVISMYSCEEVIPEQKPESTVTLSVPYPDTAEYATITFACQGFEMDQKAMTRGELSADGKTEALYNTDANGYSQAIYRPVGKID